MKMDSVIVADEDGHHDTAEDEHHIHVGVLADVIHHIERRLAGHHLPGVGVELYCVAGCVHAAGAKDHRGDDRGNTQKDVIAAIPKKM